MHSDYDTTNVMHGAKTTAELDIYRGEPKPRLEPLLLDTVMQGRPRVSNCRLLQIPSEILAKIVSFVAEDKKALQQLALVNSDCCGLSRACQFSDFTFDYSPNKLKLLLQLAEDSREGRVGPGIKDCVRKFTFKPDPYHARAVHSEAWQMFQEDPGDGYEETGEIKERAASAFAGVQRIVVISLHAMRNLETLVWSCKFPIKKETLSLFTLTTAHNLLINGALISEDFSLGPPMTPASWPLRSLVLMNNSFPALFPNSRITGLGDMEPRTVAASLSWNRFKVLSQTTKAANQTRSRCNRWTKFYFFPIGAPQVSRTGTFSFSEFDDIIRSQVEEPYRDLEELVVNHDDDSQLVTEFIHKHNNLKKLWVTQGYYISNKDAGRDEDHFDIMPESLAAICELTTLEQLGLRCLEMMPEFESYEDFTDDTYPVWLIDHGRLQAHLQNLKNLKLLVIRGDTYPPRLDDFLRHIDYYKSIFANEEDYQTAKDHPELAPFVQGPYESKLAWQHAHLYRMLEHTRSYRKVLPKFEWILCGQRPMKFIENPEGVVQPHPVGKERDECKTFVGRVFGLASEVEIAHEMA
ncbi:uncharacterized protein FFB14_09817 [Fusarium fujikuroi]|nr:uncharacterized protein FFB14_09817 [Fusarium fujikuroi]